jgi:hypothetical protein
MQASVIGDPCILNLLNLLDLFSQLVELGTRNVDLLPSSPPITTSVEYHPKWKPA